MNIGLGEISYAQMSDLSKDEVVELWNFTSGSVSRARELFDAMLMTRDGIYRLRDHAGQLRGCIAIKTVRRRIHGRPVAVVFGNLARIDPSFRGAGVLQLAGLHALLSEAARHPSRRIYGSFAASSFVSYVALARTFRDYWPHATRSIPRFERAVLEAMMPELLALVPSRRWVPKRCVVELVGREEWSEGQIHQAARLPPEAEVYARLNPYQERGDALVALMPLSLGNLAAMTSFILRRGLRRWRRAGAPDRA